MQTDENRVLFLGGHPILNVNNVAESLDYYCHKLGFTMDFCWPPSSRKAPEKTPPTFAQVNRGQFSLMLAQQEQGGPAMWIYLDLPSRESVVRLHQEYQANGVTITQPPTDQQWDMCEMLVEDRDGHVLRIGGPLPHE